jgi:energy-coupling factor transporter ATP-binding protein EcfA2
MDFYQFRTKEAKSGIMELYPAFTVGRSTDLMVRGGDFYAVWDEARGLWSTDEFDVARLVDEELRAHAKTSESWFTIKEMQDFESGSWSTFQRYIGQISDNSMPLDQTLTFQDSEVKKTDYASKRLPYSLQEGSMAAYEELAGTLYSVEEREKFEWCIGAVLAGEAKRLQKFAVFYGPPGSGKGTILKIIAKLFQGYTTSFDAKALGSNNAQFATEVFRTLPLVAIQEDGDLSRIEDNARLNMIISHEEMPMNEKFKSSYTATIDAFLFMGTNQPVKISDAKSGILRRLIDIHPSGATVPEARYQVLMNQIDFELGAIAQHCLNVYLSRGKHYYSRYRPLEMMFKTDVFFNYIEHYYDIFRDQNGVSLAQAYALYKEFCEEMNIPRPLPQYKFREELKNYFTDFRDRAEVDGHIVRHYYQGFSAAKFKQPVPDDVAAYSLVLEDSRSLLDEEWADMPAQLANVRELPKRKWENVDTKLKQVDTSQVHYVKVPEGHIVIDFDLKDENGEKSLERNIKAASSWPATYAELSKSGAGVHLHYRWLGSDTRELAVEFSDGIEVKAYHGDSALRRKVTKCNSVPIADISSGLPLKEKRMLDVNTIQSEKGLRALIARNLAKEIHPDTKSSMGFIKHILDEHYAGGASYNVEDLKPKIIAFAANSSNQAVECIKIAQQIKWKSDDADQVVEERVPENRPDEYGRLPQKSVFHKEEPIVFYDVEVYPNLFVVCWKKQGDSTIVKMVNPSQSDIEALLKMRLVGFYNRRYDNHILYAAFMGYTVAQLYALSQKLIVDNNAGAYFGEAFGLSYADIWDFASIKLSLKKWEIKLGLPHVEMDIPWDQPVPEELIQKVVDYCCNDVMATEAVFEDRKQDFVARQILAELSGLSVNDTTQKHTARIIFGDDRQAQKQFNKPDLRELFPGYDFDQMRPAAEGKSRYRGEDPSEGGYVYAEPGMYSNVDVWDVASMHPTSIVQLNLFGKYTPNFAALLDARLAIKHGDYETARTMMNGKLAPHLQNEADADALSYALKIVINIVYGLTSAKFDNAFRDIRNHDNVVAKRGALFMIDLKNFVQERGFKVVHIKTDSIKVPDATPELKEEVWAFAEKYGYTFEHEATYSKFCLVNDAVYIAKYGWAAKERLIGTWDATGAQFQHPYVFKTLFAGGPIEFDDMCEAKSVIQGAMYLDFEHDKPREDKTDISGMKFVGKTGRFVPVQENQGGAVLYRIKDGKRFAVTGTKGYLWMEADHALSTGAKIDFSYFEKLADNAVKTIGKFDDFDVLVADD